MFSRFVTEININTSLRAIKICCVHFKKSISFTFSFRIMELESKWKKYLCRMFIANTATFVQLLKIFVSNFKQHFLIWNFAFAMNLRKFLKIPNPSQLIIILSATIFNFWSIKQNDAIKRNCFSNVFLNTPTITT